MGLAAWTGVAESNPQMAMKCLSFKLRFIGRKITAPEVSRAAPPAVHADVTERTGEL